MDKPRKSDKRCKRHKRNKRDRSSRRPLPPFLRRRGVDATSCRAPEQPDGRYATQEILEALAAIPLDMRIAVVLHQLEGWTSAEIADLVGVPAGTAATRVRRGVRHVLRAFIR